MRRTPAPLGLALLTALAACAPTRGTFERLVCVSDRECAEGEVCFANGCGDPSADLVVEVTPGGATSNLQTQDFAVPLLRRQLNLTLFADTGVSGVVRRASASGPVPYTAQVTLRADGISTLLPGRVRRATSTFAPSQGAYSLGLGNGTYTLTLTPAAPDLPPVTRQVRVELQQRASVDFELPQQAVALQGRVTREGGTVVDADLLVQALDPQGRPLSQRAPVSRTTGDFTLFLAPEALQLARVTLRVGPGASAPLVPEKDFPDVDPRSSFAGTLSLGAFGTPTAVRGTVLDPQGAPIAAASVYLEGTVAGGGTLRTAPVPTGTDGRFELLTLPSPSGGTLKLVLVPPATSAGTLTQRGVNVPQTSAGTELGELRCGPRTRATGSLLLPDTRPAAGARVVATPVVAQAGLPLPPTGAQAVVDADGNFALRLDPAIYRLEFTPAEALPLVSRYVVVAAAPADTVQPLGTFQLSAGRQVSGSVTVGEGGPVVPYATLRFFRVSAAPEGTVSELLAQTVSDTAGGYTVTLPTR